MTLPVVTPVGTRATTPVFDQVLLLAVCPLKVTVPAVAPKLLPVIVTDIPAAPVLGDKEAMTGATVNVTPLLTTPPASATTTLPVVAPDGTTAEMPVPVQLETAALAPLNVTPPLPWDEPKLLPVMTTEEPTAPEFGVRLLITGVALTVKPTPALATPPLAATTTLPLVAPGGTTAVMLVEFQLEIVAATPLNVTPPLPCAGPKLLPAMRTEEPIAPEFGARLLMLGGVVTVKFTPALATPPAAVTTTLPVTAPAGTVAVMLVLLQEPTVATVPLNVILPLPWVTPKLDPVIVIREPMGPLAGVRMVMLGGAVTVNAALLVPPTVLITRFPVVAPEGMVIVIPASDHELGVAALPPTVTVLVP
jgi:hypothetical protein